MGKPTAKSKIERGRGDAKEGSKSKQMEADVNGDPQLNRKSQGYGFSGPAGDPVTTARKRKEDEHKNNKQLKKMQAVVVLRRLTNQEIEKACKREEPPQKAQLQARFPTEIFTMILGYLKDPTDLQNCSRAHPFLSDILTPRKPQYLFEQVLPHVLGHLSLDDLKNCRLVCNEWNRDVNELIENRPCVRPYNDEVFLKEMENHQTRQNFGVTPHSRLRPFAQIKTDRASLEEFAASYNSLNFGGRNPFLGGAVEFLVEPTPDIMDNVHLNNEAMILLLRHHVIALRSFLVKFGRFIDHLRLKSQEVAPLVETRCLNYALLCLRRCPNLKTISIDMSHQENIIPHGRVFMLVGEAATLLGGHLPLPQLHTIELAGRSAIRIPPVVMNQLLPPHMTQLQKLSFPCLSHLPRMRTSTSGISGFRAPNLKELLIERIWSNRILERLSEVEAPVEKLMLKFRYGDLNLSRLLRELNRFPLRHLELDWVPGYHPNIPAPGPTQILPEIPSVHTLMMTNSEELDYSFLRSFPNLKHLYLHDQVIDNGLYSRPSFLVMTEIANSEDVQIHKYGGRINYSNIWNIFPNLEVVIFERIRMTDGTPAEKWKLTWGRPENRRQAQ